MIIIELVVAISLIALNGALALSELAIVSARRSKLKAQADAGSPGASAALALASNPGRFLSTVQVGITLIGVLAGAFSGVTFGERLGAGLAEAGVPAAYAQSIGIGAVVVVISYLSVIIGELVPKQLALRNPERLAIAVAPMMTRAARVATPVVTLLDASGRALLRAIGSTETPRARVTDEDIRALIAEAASSGVIEPEERSMIAGVMRLGDRRVRALMTPRREVDMIDLSASPEQIERRLRESGHSRFPAYYDTPDDVVGIVQAKDLLDAYLDTGVLDARTHVRAAPVVPDTIDALDVLETLKASPVHVALVHDEYGHFQGIVTTYDILEAIAGTFRTEGPPEPNVVRRADGSLLLAGDMPVDELAEVLDIRVPAERDYDTLGGFMLTMLGRIPTAGEEVLDQGWRLEVVDLDGRRIDKVLASRIALTRRQI